jgi:hypothetical protein
MFTHSEVMQYRWLKILQGNLPDADLEDVNALLDDPQAGRQFAPEFSQVAY